MLRAGDEEPAFESIAQRFFAGNDLVGATIGAGAAFAVLIARGLAPALNACERELTEITRLLVDARDADELLLFERLTRLEAEIESTLSQSLHRFSGAAAYDDLTWTLCQRLCAHNVARGAARRYRRHMRRALLNRPVEPAGCSFRYGNPTRNFALRVGHS